MFPPVWDRVVLGHYRHADATIAGFKRLRVRGEDYPALIVDPGAMALSGRVYFDVAAADIARLDHFETSDYARVAIAVSVHGKSLSADAYLSLKPESLDDQTWDPEYFAQHGMGRFLATYATTNAPPE